MQKAGLRFLYATRFGRVVLRHMMGPGFSRRIGRWMDSRLSKPLVWWAYLTRREAFRQAQYKRPKFYRSYNDFFTRPFVREPVQIPPGGVISPGDGWLTCVPLSAEGSFQIKGMPYTLVSLLGDAELAAYYAGGTMCLVRLTTRDEHRFGYAVAGQVGCLVRLEGKLHSVMPYATALEPVYAENRRSYTITTAGNGAKVAQIEVGALCIGRIDYTCEGPHTADLEQERGRFCYGGSSIAVLLPPQGYDILPQEGDETPDGEVHIIKGQMLAQEA